MDSKSASILLDAATWNFLEFRFGGLRFELGATAHEPTSGRELTTEQRREMRERRFAEFERIRKNIENVLMRRQEVTDVCDLFGEEELAHTPEIRGYFYSSLHPLVIVLQLPVGLQDIDRDESGTKTECFFVVLDGSLMYVAAYSTGVEPTLGFPDARDKLLEIIQTVGPKIIPPNVTRAGLLVANAGSNIPTKRWASACMNLEKTSTVRRALKIIYLKYAWKMSKFYEVNQITQMTRKTSREITSEQHELLDSLGKYLSTRIYQFWQRRSLSKQIHLKISKVLELLSTYHSLTQELQTVIELFEERGLSSDEILRQFLEDEMWKKDVSAKKIDIESTLAIVEHARNEMEISGVVSVTIWAALIGAIAGSVLTLLLSRFV